jgi:hypothetical protein
MKIRKYNEAWGARAPYGDAEDQRRRDKEREEYDKLARKHNRDEFYDYVKSCFINLIERAEGYGLGDENIFEIYEEEDNEYNQKPSMCLFIDLRAPSEVTKIATITTPFRNIDSENVISNLIQYNDYVNETYKDVLSCLTLVKQQYPNCVYQIQTGDTEINKINSEINFSYMYWIGLNFFLEK